MKFETLEIEPQKNPAVLDTATWESASAWHGISTIDELFFISVSKAIKEQRPLPLDERCVVYSNSCAKYQEMFFSLAKLADGQHIFIEIGTDGSESPLEDPIGL